ncbi:MAG: hypothetical protein ABID54_05705, partial [Pseudomonadota bacterium]
LPASSGLAFPFLLALHGYPTAPANFAQGQRGSLKVKIARPRRFGQSEKGFRQQPVEIYESRVLRGHGFPRFSSLMS